MTFSVTLTSSATADRLRAEDAERRKRENEPMKPIMTNAQALSCIAGLRGTERDIALDHHLQALWDAADGNDASSEHMVEIGNTTHEKPAPFTDELSCAMALAIRLLDNDAIDIEAAYRTVGSKRYGRAEICGVLDDVSGSGATPCLALIAATLKAVDARALLQVA